jgi:hypothetical protein
LAQQFSNEQFLEQGAPSALYSAGAGHCGAGSAFVPQIALLIAAAMGNRRVFASGHDLEVIPVTLGVSSWKVSRQRLRPAPASFRTLQNTLQNAERSQRFINDFMKQPDWRNPFGRKLVRGLRQGLSERSGDDVVQVVKCTGDRSARANEIAEPRGRRCGHRPSQPIAAPCFPAASALYASD